MPPASAARAGDSPTALSGRDASRLCLSVRARLVDERGRAGAEAVARVAGTLLVAESRRLGRGFDADDVGAWCAGTAESKGRGVGPVRRAVAIRREDGWRVQVRKVRGGKAGGFLGRGAAGCAWRVALTGEVAGGGKGNGKDGRKRARERLELDFGERKDEAMAWFETLRGAVTPWAKLFGIAEDEVKNGVDLIEEELGEGEVVRAAGGKEGEAEGDSKVPEEDVSSSESEEGEGGESVPEAIGEADLPGEGVSASGRLTGLEDKLKSLAADPKVKKIRSNFVAKKAVGLLVTNKVVRKLPLPRTTPQIFVAKQVMSHVYKRRFSIKTALMRTPAERAYAKLHHVRLAYMLELFEVAGRGGNISKLAAAVDALEEKWRACDNFVIGGRRMAGIVGKPAAVYAETEELAEELSRVDFMATGKWEDAQAESVDHLLRSFGSGLTAVS